MHELQELLRVSMLRIPLPEKQKEKIYKKEPLKKQLEMQVIYEFFWLLVTR